MVKIEITNNRLSLTASEGKILTLKSIYPGNIKGAVQARISWASNQVNFSQKIVDALVFILQVSPREVIVISDDEQFPPGNPEVDY